MEYPVRSRKKMKEKAHMVKRSSVGAELHHLNEDKSITTDPGENNKRRTLRLEKKQNSWGFTLQTYGIKHKKTKEIEIMTYVDYVEFGGAAWMAGMRRGDVILSVNGEKVVEVTHQQLVSKIRQAGNILRLVVLFEDCCRKVELHERFLKLKAVLKSKYQELKEIEQQEMQILDNYYQSKGLNRFEQIRNSIMSNVSSNSDSWDAYSMIASPNGMLSTGNFAHGQWSSVTSLKSFSVDDTSSIYEDECSYIDSESDSDGKSMSLDHHGNNVNKHYSESNLTKYSTGEVQRVKDIARIRMSRSSDSKLYRRSLSPLIPGRRLLKENVESVESIADDVFEKDENQRIESDSPFSKSKMFYAGENGNIIVPKICIEGQDMFTTFHEIDTNENENVPHIDPETYRDKIVAIEIAREMAKFEKLGANHQTHMNEKQSKISETDTCPHDKSKELKSNSNKETKDARYSPKLSGKLNSTNTGNENVLESQSGKTNGAMLKYSSSLKNRGAGSPRGGSPKTERSLVPGIGGSMSYDQLKSSVPDIRVSFHTEECEVIYINEKDETTKL